jgi:hypothetical protein
MATRKFSSWQHAGVALLTALCAQAALAQPAPAAKPAPAPAAAPAPAPAAAPAPAPAATAAPVIPTPAPIAAPMAAPAPAAAPAADAPKKRYVARKPRAACTKLDDPWDNLCAIQKKADVACADLPTGKRAAARKRGAPAAPVVGNPRKECVDSYMRNV